jgi:hypothetical protein
LIVFGGPEAPFLFILLCHPSEDSLQWSTIPDGSPSKDCEEEIAGSEQRTAGLQSGVATNEPPLLPNEPPLRSHRPVIQAVCLQYMPVCLLICSSM